MMKEVIGFTGIKALQRLAERLSDPEVDGITLEVGHTEEGVYLLALDDRGFKVLLTVTEAKAVLLAIAGMLEAAPEMSAVTGLRMLAEALMLGVNHAKQAERHTVH
jgi:hypothetical protein